MKVHRQKSDQICKSGSSIKANEPSEVQSRIDSLQSNWDSLNGLSQLRTKQLQDAAEAYQVIRFFNLFFFYLLWRYITSKILS